MHGLSTRLGSGRSFAVTLALVVGAMVVPALSPSALAADPCAPGGSKIVCENSKPGTDASIWDISGAGSNGIQGFSTDISVNVGTRIDFKIDTAASNYDITIYRTGYYNGDGARRIATVTPSAALPQRQPQCITDATTELYDCGNWAVSASWNVPSTAVSGVYVALLRVPSTGDRSHITFVVRDDASRSDLIFQTSDTSWQAYNNYGGSDFYQGGANGRAYKLSYNRPVTTRGDNGGRDFYFSAEYPLVRFLEKNGYDVTYQAGVDTDRRGQLLTNHKVFMSVGHDEYWSAAQRTNVEAARDAGVSLQFLSGNEMYWKVRYENSADASNTPYRTMVSYKETWAHAKIDPSPEWTGTWRDPRFAPASRGGGRPENELTGTAYLSNFSDLAINVTSTEGKFRLWRNTTLGAMPGPQTELAPHTIGYESNEDLDNGARPDGLIRMSTTVGAVPQVLQDFGNTTAEGTTTHHITQYRAPSGALVFSAGTIQWTWGLDGVHDRVGGAADPRMQQAQVNLFADMGVQPATLDPTLTVAAASTDTTPPTATIGSPAPGSTQTNGSLVTVSGTAADVGGRVAGVEVSVDGGGTWHAADGTTSWNYGYIQREVGPTTIRVRAMDDSANIGTAVTRNVNAACPCSIFGVEVPKTPAVADAASAELGLRFTAASDGFVNGVRFYKGQGNTGTHVGSLWSNSGEKLASVTFSGETASGWQTAAFTSAVAVAAGQKYVVSYTVPNGRYAAQTYAFSAAPHDTGPLLVDGGFGATPAGVFAQAGTFPSLSFRNTNYYVDVLFATEDASPLIATNQSPTPGSSSVSTRAKVSARFSKPLAAGSAGLVLKDSTGATVAGTTSYESATRTITFTPAELLAGFVTYTATVSGTDAQGNDISSGKTWSFTTGRPPSPPGVCPCTLFDEDLLPTVLEASDGSPLTLGVRFTATKKGLVEGVKFYKAPGNTGIHVGTLWTAGGTSLATGTFTNESTSGWQMLTFDPPVAIAKDTTYVASYRSNGVFSTTPNAFSAADLSRGPLRVTATSGAYAYGSTFPANPVAHNYLVDPVFVPAVPSIAIASQVPAPGATNITRGSTVKVVLTSEVAPGYALGVSHGGAPVGGTTTINADRTKLTFVPDQLLPRDTDVTVSLSGVVSTEGAALANQQWTFRTRTTDEGAPHSMFGDLTPAVASAGDASPVELGTAFTPRKDGLVTAISFFKGTGNAGTHTGSLWSASGTRLATVTFTGETATGWQTATLATPVNVSAGQEYVVSYLAPQGHYSVTSGFFSTPHTEGDLTAPASGNGRYLYGGGFPIYSWNATNYFVDVVYEATAPSIRVTGRSPADGGTDVSTAARPSIGFSAPIAAGWSLSVSQGGTAIPGDTALSPDARTLTFTPTTRLPAGAQVTVTVNGVRSTDGVDLAPQSWTFATEPAPTVAASLFGDLTPTVADAGDPAAVELGTAFTPTVDGVVTAIRFYKGAGNTGTHTGSVWSTDGTRLATVTFVGETSSGWQRAPLATPLALTAGQTYVVSYYAPNGHYPVTGGFFAGGWTSGPLTAPAANNGRYLYGGGFPVSSWNATNYYVDVEFRHSTP